MNSTNNDDNPADSSEQYEAAYYLGVQDIIKINDEITGGDPRIRDLHLLYSALRRPGIVLFGQPQFPTLLDKAAALMESLAYHHLFADGNKRTAVQAVSLFLERNGQRFDYDAAKDSEFVLQIAQGEQNTDQIAVWLAARVKPSI